MYKIYKIIIILNIEISDEKIKNGTCMNYVYLFNTLTLICYDDISED